MTACKIVLNVAASLCYTPASLTSYISPVNTQHGERRFLSCCPTSRLSPSTLEWDYETIRCHLRRPDNGRTWNACFLESVFIKDSGHYWCLQLETRVKRAWNIKKYCAGFGVHTFSASHDSDIFKTILLYVSIIHKLMVGLPTFLNQLGHMMHQSKDTKWNLNSVGLFNIKISLKPYELHEFKITTVNFLKRSFYV